MSCPRLVAVLALVAACSPGAGKAADSPTYATILEAPPYPATQRRAPYTPTLEDRRFLFADRIESRHLPLLRRMKAEAMGNFGGIEWRWRDGPQNGGLGALAGIAFFLKEPEKSLARFTRDPLFRAAKGVFARTEQEKVARQWAQAIGPDIAREGFDNVEVPTLTVALPRAEFDRLVRSKGWRLPANLGIRLDPYADPNLPSVPADLRPLIRAFPQEQRLAGPTPDIATFDTIVLRDGCFFIDLPGEEDPLAEFPLGIGLHRDAQGHLAFRPRYAHDKRRLGRVGTRLQLGYRSQPRAAPPELGRACNASTIVTVTSVDQGLGYGGVSAVPPPPPAPAPQRRIKRAEPNRNGICRFEERDRGARPKGLVQTNFHSNVIFWADRGAALWDHPNGEIDEGMVIPGKRIIAAREGMKDLWISPGRPGDIMLFSGPDRLECVMREDDTR